MKLKVLHLTLSKPPFDVMETGEKDREYRKPTKWILSRLFNKDGTKKEYDVVRFVNGYGDKFPQFISEYKGFDFMCGPMDLKYSNGLTVKVEAGDIEIRLGKIGIRRNILK